MKLLTIKIAALTFLAATFSLALFSFTIQKTLNDDFLKLLGINKANANTRITNSFLQGYLDYDGIKNLKNIATGNRTALTKDLLTYARQYVTSAAFIKEYNAMRESFKPKFEPVKTAEELQQANIAQAKKAVADTEASIQKADASTKKLLEPLLEPARKRLKDAEDPNNKGMANYKKNYPELVKSKEAAYQNQIANWEAQYPGNQLLYVKQRLQQFLDETKDVDFSAALYEKKGIKYFTNPAYERKSNNWKMAFRAGRETVEPARSFVQEWIVTLK